jgi:hypothetical protein
MNHDDSNSEVGLSILASGDIRVLYYYNLLLYCERAMTQHLGTTDSKSRRTTLLLLFRGMMTRRTMVIIILNLNSSS